jgi:dipeptidyl aminopeptidase/acylaminoacyl peptidase
MSEYLNKTNFKYSSHLFIFLLLVVCLLLVIPKSILAGEAVFSIRTATLAGNNIQTIYTDRYRQATHIRVSPNGRWIMFSRYNDKEKKSGLAMENIDGKNHYENTELILMRSDGSELRSIVPPRKGIIAVNSNWTDDGKGFVFLSNDNKKRVLEIRRAYLNSKMEITHFSTIRLPKYIVPVDPHLHKGRLVFPAVDLRNMQRGLWIANEDGSDLRKLTTPRDPDSGKPVKHPDSGDNDPRFSPDGSQVAFMRLVKGKGLWSIYTVDVATGKEASLTRKHLSPTQLDAVPEWSGDGNLLIFWTADIKKVEFSITSLKPNGSKRYTVLKNPYQFHQSPAFFPNTGSGPHAKIAYSVRNVPKWQVKLRRLLSKP